MSYDLTHLTRQKDNKALAEKVKLEMDNIKEDVSDLKSALTQQNIATLHNGYVKNSDGEIVAHDTYGYSDMIAVAPGDTYIYDGLNGSGVALLIAAYENKTDNAAVIAKSLRGTGSAMSGEYVIPSGINYIRITSNPKGTGVLYKSDKTLYNQIGFANVEQKNKIAAYRYSTDQEINGITFHKNDDGTIYAHGTATADAGYTVAGPVDMPLQSGSYILNGCPIGGTPSTFMLLFHNASVNSGNLYDYGLGVNVPFVENSTWNITIMVKNGTAIDAVFKPMLRSASVADDSYEPYYHSIYEYVQFQEKQTNDALYGTIKHGTKEIVNAETVVWNSNTYINANTGELVTGASDVFVTSDLIEMPKGVTCCAYAHFIDGNGDDSQTFRVIYTYDSNGSPKRRITTNPGLVTFSIYEDEKYIRINLNRSEIYVLRVYKQAVGYGERIEIKEDVYIPEKEQKKGPVYPYVHARRPLITFVLDGDYDMNDDMEEVFSNHNVRAGFAPWYNDNYVNNTLQTYLNWQAKGHEILVHSQYSVVVDNPEPIIKGAYEQMTNYGFKMYGFVALAGNSNEQAVTAVKKYFDYGFTKTNHSGSYSGDIAIPCMTFGTDKPYEMWRYSMQTSTLDQMKAAVDDCLANNKLLVFYGHAMSSEEDYFTPENLDALISYIESKNGNIVLPHEAVENFFAVRYDDIYGLL